MPKNKAATEHIGTVDRVVFCSPSRDFCILLLTDGSTMLGMTDPEPFAPKTSWRFMGKWEDGDKRGPRFRFQVSVPHQGHGRTGVVRYLTTTCTGIGEKTAARLFEKFGGEVVELLRTDPTKVAEECGVKRDVCDNASSELENAKRFQATKIDLFGLFNGRGFTGALIERAIEKWSVRAPIIIKRNPFAMLGLPSAGFRRCDKLWVDLNLPKDSLKRTAVVAHHLIKSDTNGNTWLSASDLAARLREMIPNCDVMKAFKLALRAQIGRAHV